MKKLYTTIALLFALIIYAQDGTLDTSFGTDGIVDIPDLCKIFSAKILPDGKILGSGYVIESNLTYKACIFRLNPDGSLDTSFDSDGKLVFNYFGTYDSVISLYVYADGKILAGLEYGKLLRLNQDGSYDTTFGTNGIVDTTGYYIAVQPDGKIVSTAVYTVGYFKIFRHNSDGSPDLTFNTIGSNNIQINTNSCTVKDIVLQPNGQILVTGYGPNFIGSENMTTIRLNTDGTKDTTFSLPIVSTLKIPQKIYSQGNSIFILTQTDTGTSPVAVMKYSPSNILDVNFDNDGYSLNSYGDSTTSTNRPSMLNFQPDGKIIMTEKRQDYPFANDSFDGVISRQNTDGSLDTTFGINGYASLYLGSYKDYPLLSVISPIDGKLIVLGTYLYNTGTGDSKQVRIAKYNTGILLKNEMFNNTMLTIYPNPTNNVLNVQTNEIIKQINILDIAGRKTLTPNLINNQIEVSSLSKGVYFLEIKTENKVHREKFIKN